MRSLLFVPADSAKKLDKAMTSGADALIVDLEDSVALEGKARARQSAAAFLKAAIATKPRPYLLVRVNGLTTGLTDIDLDTIAPAKPDAIMLPKAEGGPSGGNADARPGGRGASDPPRAGPVPRSIPPGARTLPCRRVLGWRAGNRHRLRRFSR